MNVWVPLSATFSTQLYTIYKTSKQWIKINQWFWNITFSNTNTIPLFSTTSLCKRKILLFISLSFQWNKEAIPIKINWTSILNSAIALLTLPFVPSSHDMNSVVLHEHCPRRTRWKKNIRELKLTAASGGIPEVIILLNEVREKCYTFSPETPDPKPVVLPGDVPHFSERKINISFKVLLKKVILSLGALRKWNGKPFVLLNDGSIVPFNK